MRHHHDSFLRTGNSPTSVGLFSPAKTSGRVINQVPRFVLLSCVIIGFAVPSALATDPPPPQKSFEDIGDVWVGDIGDAIDPFSGDLVYSETDVSLPARGGLSMGFTRTYTSGFYKPKFANGYDCRLDSSFARSVFMGVGWMIPTCRILGDTITWPGGGSEVMFHDNSAWGKAHGRLKTKSFAIYTNHYDVTSVTDTTWTDTLLFLDGSRWLFSKRWENGADTLLHGKFLRRMEDRYGNYIEYLYFSSLPVLKEIRESTGRRIWFTYDNMTGSGEPTDTSLLVATSWLNHAGDSISTQYSYSLLYAGEDTVGVKYLSRVLHPNGDSTKYEYVDTTAEDMSGTEACTYDMTQFPDFLLLKAIKFTGGSTVEYQYGRGLWQYCYPQYQGDYGTTRLSVRRRIRDGNDTTEFASLSTATVQSGQQIYIWNNTSGDSTVYSYHYYFCWDEAQSCNSNVTSAGVDWIRRYDLRAQTCGSRTTPIWERHFDWCDTYIGYDSLVEPYGPIWIPHPKRTVTVLCGDTVSVVETSIDTCTGETLGSYKRLSQDSDDEWVRDTVLLRAFDDSAWTSMLIDNRTIEKSLGGQDTAWTHVYWNADKVRPTGQRIGTGADTILISRVDSVSSHGNVIRVIDASGNARETHYDASGTFVVSSKNDQNGNSYLLSTYSPYSGVLLKIEDTVAAESTLYYYDSADQLTRVRRPLDGSDSSVVKHSYHGARTARDSVKFRPGVYLTSESYADIGGRYSQSKAIGSATVLSRSYSDPLAREVRSVRPRYSTDSDSSVAKSYVDGLGRPRRSVRPTGEVDSVVYSYRTSVQYDALGNAVMKSVTDGFGRIIKTWADSGFTDSVVYRYEPFGRLRAVINPMGDSSYTKYDEFGRPDTSREVDHDSVKAVYYDRVGNPRIVKNPMGKWVYYKYDKLNRPIEFGIAAGNLSPDSAIAPAYPDTGITVLVRYTYDTYAGDSLASDSGSYVDPHGYMTKRWERQGSSGESYTIFYYDVRGRLAQESIKLDGLSVKTIKYRYNLGDALDTLEYPNGQMIRFNYDDLGRLIEIPNFVDSVSSPGFVYEPWGALREIRYDGSLNWLQSKFFYDKLSRDTLEFTVNHREIGGDTIWWGARYAYNSLGQIDSICSVDLSGSPVLKVGQYKYTRLGQLDTAYSRSRIVPSLQKTQRWSYDNNGKWTATTLDGTTTTFTYASGRGRLVRKAAGGNGFGYVYDAWGNVVYDSSKVDQYTYDYTTNVLHKILPGGTGPHHDSLTFFYDALGRKVKEKYTFWYQDECPVDTNPWPGDTTIYTSYGNVPYGPEEGGESGTASSGGGDTCWYSTTSVTYYIWQGDRVIAEYEGNGALRSNFLYANGKQIARFTDQSSGNIGYVVSDHQGSLRAFSQKEAQWGYMWKKVDYHPFGQILWQERTGPVEDYYLYTGKEWKDVADVNLTYYGARWYDATVGRFLQTDPAGEGTNAYSLAMNNPIMGVDPWGLETAWHYLYILRIFGGYRQYSAFLSQERAAWESRVGEATLNTGPRSEEAWLSPHESVPDPHYNQLPENVVNRMMRSVLIPEEAQDAGLAVSESGQWEFRYTWLESHEGTSYWAGEPFESECVLPGSTVHSVSITYGQGDIFYYQKPPTGRGIIDYGEDKSIPQAAIVLNATELLTSYGYSWGNSGPRQGPVIRNISNELDGGILYAVVSPPPQTNLFGKVTEAARKAGRPSMGGSAPRDNLDYTQPYVNSIQWVASIYNLPPGWPSRITLPSSR